MILRFKFQIISILLSQITGGVGLALSLAALAGGLFYTLGGSSKDENESHEDLSSDEESLEAVKEEEAALVKKDSK